MRSPLAWVSPCSSSSLASWEKATTAVAIHSPGNGRRLGHYSGIGYIGNGENCGIWRGIRLGQIGLLLGESAQQRRGFAEPGALATAEIAGHSDLLVEKFLRPNAGFGV